MLVLKVAGRVNMENTCPGKRGQPKPRLPPAPNRVTLAERSPVCPTQQRSHMLMISCFD